MTAAQLAAQAWEQGFWVGVAGCVVCLAPSLGFRKLLDFMEMGYREAVMNANMQAHRNMEQARKDAEARSEGDQ